MGSSNTKEVDSNGQVNNNIFVDETIDQNANEITLFIAIICIIKLIEFFVFIYRIIYHQGKRTTGQA